MTIVTRQTANRPTQYLVRVVGDHTSPVTLWHADRATACNLSDTEARRIMTICQHRANMAAHHIDAMRERAGVYGVEQ